MVAIHALIAYVMHVCHLPASVSYLEVFNACQVLQINWTEHSWHQAVHWVYDMNGKLQLLLMTCAGGIFCRSLQAAVLPQGTLDEGHTIGYKVS